MNTELQECLKRGHTPVELDLAGVSTFLVAKRGDTQQVIAEVKLCQHCSMVYWEAGPGYDKLREDQNKVKNERLAKQSAQNSKFNNRLKKKS